MKTKKHISVVVPIFNEVSMIDELCIRVRTVFRSLDQYTYEIVFFDDGSTDGTREKIQELCAQWDDVKGVLYSRNFGYLKTTFYSMQQAKGDCAIMVHADLQNPPELIPEFLKKWEAGAQVVLGVKNQSRENRFMYFLRSVFYFLMIRLFGVPLIPHATEFELFDKSFIEILRNIKTNTPFLRGIVREYAANIDCVYYTQDARKKGRSKFNLNRYYDFAICGITQYSAVVPRKVISGSVIAFVLLLIETIVTAAVCLPQEEPLMILNAVVIRCILAALCILIAVVGLIFEFLISLSQNSAEKPLVLEEKRINY